LRHDTKARRRLLQVLQVTTAREVALRCGVHPSRVTRWASGESLPGEKPVGVLETVYGIPGRLWRQPVNLA